MWCDAFFLPPTHPAEVAALRPVLQAARRLLASPPADWQPLIRAMVQADAADGGYRTLLVLGIRAHAATPARQRLALIELALFARKCAARCAPCAAVPQLVAP